MLIQKVARSDSIVAATMHPADFCNNMAYFTMMTARPQTVGYGATDSPAGLAAWILVHPGFAQWSFDADPKQPPTKDDVLDNITLYWLTNTAASAARLYWEN